MDPRAKELAYALHRARHGQPVEAAAEREQDTTDDGEQLDIFHQPAAQEPPGYNEFPPGF